MLLIALIASLDRWCLGRGRRFPQTLEEIVAGMRMVAEGVKTAISVDALSTKMGVEMPICQEVFEASRSNSRKDHT